MACTVVYKGVTYSEPEFVTYVKENFSEFEGIIPAVLTREINTPKFTQPFTGEEVSSS